MLPQILALAALAAGAQAFQNEADDLSNKKKKKKRSPASESKKQAIEEYLRKSKEKERKVHKGKNDNTEN